jgi:hypothetical protein
LSSGNVHTREIGSCTIFTCLCNNKCPSYITCFRSSNLNSGVRERERTCGKDSEFHLTRRVYKRSTSASSLKTLTTYTLVECWHEWQLSRCMQTIYFASTMHASYVMTYEHTCLCRIKCLLQNFRLFHIWFRATDGYLRMCDSHRGTTTAEHRSNVKY